MNPPQSPPPRASSPAIHSTFRNYLALLDTFTTFLTVAIHTILYERSLYPQASFLLARKYNAPVRQNRHPEVCRWIEDAVEAVRRQMMRGTVERIALVIFSPVFESQKPPLALERFVFDLSRFPVVAATDALEEFEAAEEEEQGQHQEEGGAEAQEEKKPPEGEAEVESDEDSDTDPLPGIDIVDLEEQFHGVMRRLATCSSMLGPLGVVSPESCSFSICMDLKDKVDPPVGHPQPWIPAQPAHPRRKRKRKQARARALKRNGDINMAPVRVVEVGEFLLEMWVETSNAALKSFAKAKKQAAKRQAAEKKLAEQQATKKKLAEKEAIKKKLTERQAFEREAAEKAVAEREAAAKEGTEQAGNAEQKPGRRVTLLGTMPEEREARTAQRGLRQPAKPSAQPTKSILKK